MSTNWTLAVDFGTTSTVTAMGDSAGSSEILEVDGNRKMPSMVVVDNDHTIVVGIAAAGLARSMPQRTIRTPKNRLGDAVPIVVGGTPFQPVAFVSAVLEHVLLDATRFQGSPPTHSRLTYPATWNRPKRARLLEAAVKAGYPDPELVAEPIAAALTYGDFNTLGIGDHVAVYDLGGGTFDTVVLLRTEAGFSVVGRPLGDPQLGGELFDEILMNYIGEQMDQDMWDQLLVSDQTDWMRAAARLRSECKRAKEALSSHPVADVSVGLPGGVVDVSITRAELDDLIAPFVDESIDLLKRSIADANMTGDSIAAVYVTGGASRMPIVERRIKEAFPTTLVSRRGDPKVAVALGALLAIPGSLDESIQQSPDRTTVEELDESTNARPAPPTPPAPPPLTTPAGPETRLDDASTHAPPVQETHIDQSVPNQADPHAPTVADPPTEAPATQHAVQQQPAAFAAIAEQQAPRVSHDVPAADINIAPTPDDGGISPKIVIGSVIVVLLLVGGLAALLWPRDGGTPVATRETSDSTDSSSTTSTTSSTSTTTVAPGSMSGISVADAVLDQEDYGFDWVRHPDGDDEANQNQCGQVRLLTPLDRGLATYRTTDRSTVVTSEVRLFANADDAEAELDFARGLPEACPLPITDFQVNEDSPVEDLRGAVVPLVMNVDGANETIEIPQNVDAFWTFGYRFTLESAPTFEPHLLVANIRVNAAVGTLVLFTPGRPEQSHLNLMNAMIERLARNLEEVQR